MSRHGYDPVALTRRERECALLRVQGYNYAEIATCLGLTQRTVSRYLEEVYDKLSVHNLRGLRERMGEEVA